MAAEQQFSTSEIRQSPLIEEINSLMTYLTPQEKELVQQLMEIKTPWIPLPRQREAYYSKADELFYGGAAGGGKTDLVLGVALLEHTKSIIFRREYAQLRGVIDRANDMYRGFGQFNNTEKRWRLHDGRMIEFGACQFENDKENFQGRDHDFTGFDEITQYSESQYRFLTNWCRSSNKRQRVRVIVVGNPPITEEGAWVIRYWAPWIDEDYKGKHAKPGELRWFTTAADGTSLEAESGEPLLIKGEWVTPKSRTFIPARVEDNPYMIETGYKARLQALPEPLRSQMLYGDFLAGMSDDAQQTIPSQWVRMAQERWRTQQRPDCALSCIGIDVARGGRDRTVLSLRYGAFVTKQVILKGTDTKESAPIVDLVRKLNMNKAVCNVDVIGVGAAVYDALKTARFPAVGLNSSNKSTKKDSTGMFGFVNKRAEWWWGLREALNPEMNSTIAIPDDAELRRELCTPRWKNMLHGIQIEPKDDVKKRVGKSTDKADSLVYAFALENITKVKFGRINIMGR